MVFQRAVKKTEKPVTSISRQLVSVRLFLSAYVVSLRCQLILSARTSNFRVYALNQGYSHVDGWHPKNVEVLNRSLDGPKARVGRAHILAKKSSEWDRFTWQYAWPMGRPAGEWDRPDKTSSKSLAIGFTDHHLFALVTRQYFSDFACALELKQLLQPYCASCVKNIRENYTQEWICICLAEIVYYPVTVIWLAHTGTRWNAQNTT